MPRPASPFFPLVLYSQPPLSDARTVDLVIGLGTMQLDPARPIARIGVIAGDGDLTPKRQHTSHKSELRHHFGFDVASALMRLGLLKDRGQRRGRMAKNAAEACMNDLYAVVWPRPSPQTPATTCGF